jgi:NhaP-type Na+/H+ or K+/H+ antiporter
MKHLITITTVILTAALFYLAFPQAAFAAAEEGHSITLSQLLILGIVMGWYLYNHFKDKIKAMFKKKQ